MLNRNEAANCWALPRESREQVVGRAVAVEQHIIAAVVAAERKDRGQFFGEAALRFGRRRHRMKEPAILRRRHWQRLLVWRIIRPGGEYLPGRTANMCGTEHKILSSFHSEFLEIGRAHV